MRLAPLRIDNALTPDSFGRMKQLILPLLFLLILVPKTDARIWINQHGESFEGELIEADDKSATIRRKIDRKKFKMAIMSLSKADQVYIKKVRKGLAEITPVSGFTSINKLSNNGMAWANRKYVWMNIPDALVLKRFTMIPGGSRQAIAATVDFPGYVYIAWWKNKEVKLTREGWITTDYSFAYSSKGVNQMYVYKKKFKTGTFEIPNMGWAGPILLLQ